MFFALLAHGRRFLSGNLYLTVFDVANFGFFRLFPGALPRNRADWQDSENNREQYLDCLRELTRAARIEPCLAAMTDIQRWTAAFTYGDLDAAINSMRQCNDFERSLVKHRLLWPDGAGEDDSPEQAEASRP